MPGLKADLSGKSSPGRLRARQRRAGPPSVGFVSCGAGTSMRPAGFKVMPRAAAATIRSADDAGQLRKMEALRTLAGGIAHDLNNVLLPILINTELALLEGNIDRAVAHRLQQILEAAKQARDIVKQFLVFTQQRERQPSHAEAADALPRGTERILFVDDEELQVRAVSRMLTYLGYHVTAMSDARQALELLRLDPDSFDLLVTDMTMPSLSGGELAREALSLRPSLPIILCTGFSDAVDEEEALTSGVRVFMMKPYSIKEIAEAIRAALGPRSRRAA